MNYCKLQSLLRTFFVLSAISTFLLPDIFVDAGAGKNLEETPQNRVVLILVGFVGFSLIIEHSLEWIVEHFEEQGREGMVEVIEKIKEEFLLVGVLSFVLVGCEETLFKGCVTKPFDWWVPASHCPAIYPNYGSSSSAASGAGSDNSSATSSAASSAASSTASSASSSGSRRMLLASSSSAAGSGGSGSDCIQFFGDASYERMIDVNALHQVHLLIFFLAVGHVIASFITYYVARFTVQRWVAWEKILVAGLKEEHHHVTWTPKPGAGKLSNQMCVRHFVGWRLVFCGMDSHTLLSLRRFYISRHGLTSKFLIFEMVLEDLEHDFSDVAGIRFWMWIALCVQLAVNGTQSKVSGYYNWGNTFGTMLLAAHLRNISEDLSDKLWKHFNDKLTQAGGDSKRMSSMLRDDQDFDGDGVTHDDNVGGGGGGVDGKTKKEVNMVNDDFEDHLLKIEPSFLFGRPKLLMLWFQLVQWNSSQTITQGIWFAASGMGCYAYVRGPVVIGLAMTIASLSLIVMGYTVLPTYALMLHCGEHLRPKGRTHKKREEKKNAIHRKHSMGGAITSIMDKIRQRKEEQNNAPSQAAKLDNLTKKESVSSNSSSKYVVDVASEKSQDDIIKDHWGPTK